MFTVQTINQLYFVIIGLMLTSLFASTFSVGTDKDSGATGHLWLLSVGTRAVTLFLMAAIPIGGAPCAVLANTLFLFSAGCLALLFRSWRKPLGSRDLYSVAVFAITVGITVEIARQAYPDFRLRMILLGSASLMVSIWELIELRKKIADKPHPLIKVISAIVTVQVILSAASIATTLIYAEKNMAYMTDNGTRSMPVVWITISIHVIIYFFIGGYLYLRASEEKVSAIREKEEISALLKERERLLSSLVVSNRIASSGAFSAAVAHEISQPLAAAMLQSNLLKRRATAYMGEDQTLMQLLSDLLTNLGRSKHLLENLRKIFQQTPAQLQPCDLGQLVMNTVSLMQGRLAESDIKVEISSDQNIATKLVKQEVQQVLVNLINNSIDALETATTSSKYIRIELAHLEESVSIAITDNGTGIPAELTDSLFELASSGKSTEKGSGIGLWISKHIIEDRHKGKLYFDDGHAPGARFVVELPT